jgi:hypothetical protein
MVDAGLDSGLGLDGGLAFSRRDDLPAGGVVRHEFALLFLEGSPKSATSIPLRDTDVTDRYVLLLAKIRTGQ